MGYLSTVQEARSDTDPVLEEETYWRVFREKRRTRRVWIAGMTGTRCDMMMFT